MKDFVVWPNSFLVIAYRLMVNVSDAEEVLGRLQRSLDGRLTGPFTSEI